MNRQTYVKNHHKNKIVSLPNQIIEKLGCSDQESDYIVIHPVTKHVWETRNYFHWNKVDLTGINHVVVGTHQDYNPLNTNIIQKDFLFQ